MLKKIFSKIDKYMDEIVILKPERKNMNKSIAKVCKEHFIENDYIKMYQRIQNEILKEVNLENKETVEKGKTDNYFCTTVLFSRIYELNLEFVKNIKEENYHSSNALTRQIIELYLISALLNVDKSYCSILLGRKDGEKKIPPFKNIVEDYIGNKNHLPNFNNKSKENKESFLKYVLEEYKFYSGIFHPKEDSFIQNIWITTKDENSMMLHSRPYKSKGEKENEMIITFPKKVPWSSNDIKRMIHTFYVFSMLSFQETQKLKEYSYSKTESNAPTTKL